MGKKLIQLENITKTYDGNMILDDLNLYVKENEFLTLLGPSGCGKTLPCVLSVVLRHRTPDVLFLMEKILLLFRQMSVN